MNTEIKEFKDILAENNETTRYFAKELGMTYESFKVMTSSNRKVPKWVTSFLMGYNMSK